MPDFMLRRPDRPLTQEEMQKQADEAAARVRPPQPPASDSAGARSGEGAGEMSKKDKEGQGAVK